MGRVEVSFASFRFVEHPHTVQPIHTEKEARSAALQADVGSAVRHSKRVPDSVANYSSSVDNSKLSNLRCSPSCTQVCLKRHGAEKKTEKISTEN